MAELRIELDEAKFAKLSQAAAALGESVEEYVAHVLADVLLDVGQDVYPLTGPDYAAIDEGIAQAERGELVPSKNVHAQARALANKDEG